METKLEVDSFEIDIESLHEATMGNMRSDFASKYVAEQVIKNLTLESKKIFREYQEKENPCKWVVLIVALYSIQTSNILNALIAMGKTS